MKNVNRDYLVTVYAKTAEIISAPTDMKFYITDIHTSNIFFELIFSESTNSLVKKYSENEKASDYKLILRVLKPNNDPIYVEATQLNNSNFFVADLESEYKDFIGIYQCELLVEATTNGRQEISTTEPFEYEVVKSIFSDLGEVIEGDPDYPLLIDTLATKDYVINAMKNVSSYGYATRDYVDEAIADIYLVDYATKNYVSQALKNFDLSNYATKEYVNQVSMNGVDLTDYATKKYVDEAMSDIDSNHTHDEYLTEIPDEYVTQEELDTAINNTIIDSNIDTNDLVVTNSISIGRRANTDIGQYSTATGNNVTASGNYSHAEGYETIAKRPASHAEGGYTIASGNCQHVQGMYNIEDRSEKYAHIVGNGSRDQIDGVWVTTRSNAHTLDWYGNAWFAGTIKIGADNKELATKDYVNQAVVGADGSGIDLSDYVTEKELAEAISKVNYLADDLVVTSSISMGRKANSVVGHLSTALGSDVTASGTCSHAEGVDTTASTFYAHAEGERTTASGWSSHSEGLETTASGECSHAEGNSTIASSKYQHVQGKYNIEDSASKYAHIVGNGTGTSKRSNAHTLDWNGNAWYAGNLYIGGTSQTDANKVLSTADIKFTADGKLSVTINGVTKTFSPD